VNRLYELVNWGASSRFDTRNRHVSRFRFHAAYSREGHEAYEQLAIYYEDGVRDPQRALTLAREALDQLSVANGSHETETQRERYHQRTVEWPRSDQ
jgi:hypothetical protein